MNCYWYECYELNKSNQTKLAHVLNTDRKLWNLSLKINFKNWSDIAIGTCSFDVKTFN